MAFSSPSEYEIQQRIRLACGRGAVRLWRNNTGALVDQQGRFVRFGLCKGGSDLIALRSIEIRPELVGQRLAQFVALEVKTAQGEPPRRFCRSCLRGPAGRGPGSAAPHHDGTPVGLWAFLRDPDGQPHLELSSGQEIGLTSTPERP